MAIAELTGGVVDAAARALAESEGNVAGAAPGGELARDE